jgi:hypothetical protein
VLFRSEQITLLIGVVVAVAALFVRPVYGLVLYFASLAWYPSFLAVSVGTIDFTVRRIVILGILVKMILQTDAMRRFRMIWLDKLVIIYFAAQLASGAFTAASLMALLENRGGAVFDMVLPYFAVRVLINTREQYLQLLKGVLVIAAPLAIAGLCECITGWNPLGFLRAYGDLEGGTVYPMAAQRFGLFRAAIGFSHSIMYGLFFAMLGPTCAGLLRSVRDKTVYGIGLAFMIVGVLASVSSGPVLGALLASLFILFFPWRRHWRVAVTVIVVMCASVEIVSNRHFYDVLGDFTFSSETAWYRSRLISVALFEGGMSGHWLTGFGYGIDPGWGPRIDGMPYTDTVNHYILELHRFGLVALIPFLAMNLAAAKRLRQGYRLSVSDSDRWLIWCVSGALFGLWSAMMSVSLFGPPTSVFFVLLAFAGLLPGVLGEPAKVRANVARVRGRGEDAAFQPSISH